MTLTRREHLPTAAAALGLAALSAAPICTAAESRRGDFYGFVVCVFDEDDKGGTPLDAFPLMGSLGAGWAQGEAGGRGVLTQAIVWGNVVTC